jgi:hypothetical protein
MCVKPNWRTLNAANSVNTRRGNTERSEERNLFVRVTTTGSLKAQAHGDNTGPGLRDLLGWRGAPGNTVMR